MAIALVSRVSAGHASGGSFTTSAIDTTGANLIVIEVTGLEDGTPTVADSKSNTYTALTKYSIASSIATRLYYVASPTVGTGHTFTITFVGGLPSMCAAAFSGVHATPADQDVGATLTAAGTAHQPGNITPTQDNELVVTAIGFASEATESSVSVGSSYLPASAIQNETWTQLEGGAHFGSAMAHKIQGTLTTEDPQWTWSGSNRAVAVAASFKAAAGAVTLDMWQPRHEVIKRLGAFVVPSGFIPPNKVNQ